MLGPSSDVFFVRIGDSMKLDIRTNLRRNLLAGGINRLLMMLLPFLNRTLFLWLLGPEYLGLNGLFGSILGMLSLAELGFGTAIVCSLYKPIADDDQELICAYLAFYQKVYRVIGGLVCVVGLALLPFLRVLVKGDIPDGISLHLLYVIHLLNTTVGYFLFAYKGALLSAHQREDIHSHIRTSILLAQYLTTFALLILTRNYTLYVLSTVLFTIATNLCIEWQTRRLFPQLKPAGVLLPEHRAVVIRDVKAIFLHKIGTVISYSADNLVISSFLGLVAVAAYGNYYYVTTSVGGAVYIIFNSLTAGFGNTIKTESVDENFARFMRALKLSTPVIGFCAFMMMLLYQPFIYLWTKGNPDLVMPLLTPILMVLYFYVNYSRQLLQTFKSAAGLWKEDQWKPITSALVNLTLNLSMIHKFGLNGVIFSTIVSFAFIEIPWEASVVFKCYFQETNGAHDYSRRYWLYQLKAFLATVLACAIAAYLSTCIPKVTL